MKGRSKKFTAAVVVAVLAVAAVPAVVVASIVTNATGIAANISTKLKTNSNSILTGTSGPLNGIVSTCTGSVSQFQLSDKGGGLGPFTLAKPTFTGCTDNLGGTDTITSNITNGHWTATYVNSTGSPNPNTITLGVPKAGQTLTSSAVPGCTVTLFPSAAGTISGTYDNNGNLQFSNQALTYSAAGSCPTGTGPGNATFSTALKSGGTGVEGYQITPPILGVH